VVEAQKMAKSLRGNVLRCWRDLIAPRSVTDGRTRYLLLTRRLIARHVIYH